MHVKKGDTVKVLAGRDRGKTGKITKVFPRENLVMVEGINIKSVHEKARKKSAKGTVIEKTFPIHASNVKIDGKS